MFTGRIRVTSLFSKIGVPTGHKNICAGLCAVQSGFLCYGVSCSVFPLRRAETEPRRLSAAVPREWVLEPFSVPPCGAVAIWRQLPSGLLSIEAVILKIKILQSLWNWTGESVAVLLIHLSHLKPLKNYIKTPGFDISRTLKIKHFNSLLDRTSTGGVVMLMKTKWELCSDMKIICLHYHEGRGFQYRKQDSWNNYYSCSSALWANMVCLLMFIFLIFVIKDWETAIFLYSCISYYSQIKYNLNSCFVDLTALSDTLT